MKMNFSPHGPFFTPFQPGWRERSTRFLLGSSELLCVLKCFSCRHVCSGFAGLCKQRIELIKFFVPGEMKCILMSISHFSGVVFYQEFQGLALLNIFMFLFG